MAECRQPQASCFCMLPEGHETPHVCSCGGSFQRRGDDLYVYAFPPGSFDYEPLSQEQALTAANAYARSEPVLVEPWTPPTPFRAGRGLIEFFRPPAAVPQRTDNEA